MAYFLGRDCGFEFRASINFSEIFNILFPGGKGALTLTDKENILESGIEISDVRTVLITHIHLDHAGATGTLLKENSDIIVYVHERGAPHLIDPSKLLASATRLYGDEMDSLWGPFLPVPEKRPSPRRRQHGAR